MLLKVLLKSALMPWGYKQCENRGCFSSSVSCVKSFPGGQAPDASCIAGFLYQGSFFESVKSFASCGMRSRDCENLEPSSQ